MPRPRSLTPVQIADAALAVIDGHGLEALSMRAVGRHLGVGTMSLYRYVADRGQLEELVVDRVLAAVPLELPGGGPGQKLAALADGVRAAVAGHAAVVPLLLTHRHERVGSLRWGEAVLGVLADAGFTGRSRALAFRTVLAYVFGALQVEHLGALSGPGTEAMTRLSIDDFPLLAQTAGEARHIAPEDEFRRGFDIVVRGLGL
jgi:AcrR family transcriptional regulator